MTPTALSVRDTVVGILAAQSLTTLQQHTVTDDTPILSDGLDLDSIALLESVIAIEGALRVRIREEDLTLDALASVGRFVRHINQLVTRGRQ